MSSLKSLENLKISNLTRTWKCFDLDMTFFNSVWQNIFCLFVFFASISHKTYLDPCENCKNKHKMLILITEQLLQFLYILKSLSIEHKVNLRKHTYRFKNYNCVHVWKWHERFSTRNTVNWAKGHPEIRNVSIMCLEKLSCLVIITKDMFILKRLKKNLLITWMMFTKLHINAQKRRRRKKIN